MTELPITMDQPDGWMEKTGGYAKDMTLRDYFAAKVMQSLVLKFNEDSLDWHAHEEADIAYAIADAMLKAGQ